MISSNLKDLNILHKKRYIGTLPNNPLIGFQEDKHRSFSSSFSYIASEFKTLSCLSTSLPLASVSTALDTSVLNLLVCQIFQIGFS